MAYLASLFFLLNLFILDCEAYTSTSSCSCGFLDSTTGAVYTDALIVYFNETDVLPNGTFLAQDYANPYERNWNARFRSGADPALVVIGNETTNIPNDQSTQSLSLYLNPSLPNHLVVGSSIQSARQDMQYGTFRSSLKSPGPWSGGSSLSMLAQYNFTQAWSLNLQNTDNASTAWVSTLVHNEFASRDYGVNYTYLLESAAANHTSSPWEFMDIKVDWNSTVLNYFVGTNLTRSVAHADGPIPTVPVPLTFMHYSNGDPYAMEGPPSEKTSANVAWVRAFFNSSLMDVQDHELYDTRCQGVGHLNCDVDDMSLRDSSSFPAAATLKWKQANPPYRLRYAAIGVTSFCACFTILVILNAVYRELCLPKKPKHAGPKQLGTIEASLSTFNTSYGGRSLSNCLSSASSSISTPLRNASYTSFNGQTLIASSSCSQTTGLLSSAASGSKDEVILKEMQVGHLKPALDDQNNEHLPILNVCILPDSSAAKGKEAAVTILPIQSPNKQANVGIMALPIPPPRPVLQRKQKIVHLEGLLAFCAILVTLVHFSLTYIPAFVQPGSYYHYSAEVWIAHTLTPFVLNYTWVSLFLAVSTRFLVSNYLKNGKLDNIANKAVGRLPRLMVPVICAILIEYFFLDLGATNWLGYLPSITYSTWPYEVTFPGFGEFIDEAIELAYIIPPAQPRITFNYCIGVLWTIPVQIQGSWTALLGAIVVREIKNPWKKFAYYLLIIILAWYAQSWVGVFYFGLMLTDFDINHHYQQWLRARPSLYYPVIVFLLAGAIGGHAMDGSQAWSKINISIIENGWHPDQATGKPISQTANAGSYPEYYQPKLSGIIFAYCALALVELSPLVQTCLSIKPLVLIRPHIFTLYLLHGFVLWSVCSAACVFFATHGLPYWANMLLTAIIFYVVLAVTLVILSPSIERLGTNASVKFWRGAIEASPMRRRSLFPFAGDLLEKAKLEGSLASSATSLSGIEGKEKGIAVTVVPCEGSFSDGGRSRSE